MGTTGGYNTKCSHLGSLSLPRFPSHLKEKIIPKSCRNGEAKAEFQEEKREVNPNISTPKKTKIKIKGIFQPEAGVMPPWGKNILMTKKPQKRNPPS